MTNKPAGEYQEITFLKDDKEVSLFVYRFTWEGAVSGRQSLYCVKFFGPPQSQKEIFERGAILEQALVREFLAAEGDLYSGAKIKIKENLGPNARRDAMFAVAAGVLGPILGLIGVEAAGSYAFWATSLSIAAPVGGVYLTTKPIAMLGDSLNGTHDSENLDNAMIDHIWPATSDIILGAAFAEGLPVIFKLHSRPTYLADELGKTILFRETPFAEDVVFGGYRFYDPSFPVNSTNPRNVYRYSDPAFRPTGNDVYFGDHPTTTYFEVRQYTEGKNLIRVQLEQEKILNLTNPKVIGYYNINPTLIRTQTELAEDVYNYTDYISNVAFENGYSGILFPSAQQPGGTNLVLFGGRYDIDQWRVIFDVKAVQ